MTNNYLSAATTLVPGHTSFEAYIGGRWRLADITVGMMVFDNTTTFEANSIADIQSNMGTSGWTTSSNRKGPLNLYMLPFGDP